MELSSNLILLANCSQTGMTYTIAGGTVKKLLSETSKVSFQNKFQKLVHLVGFIIRGCFYAFLFRDVAVNSH